MHRHTRTLTAAAAVGFLGLASSAYAARSYYVLADWTKINGGASSTSYITGAWVEGNTLYSTVSSPGRITKTSNLLTNLTGDTSGEVYSELTSNAALAAVGVGQTTGVGGTTNVISVIYGFGVSGNYLQFSESSSDTVYRVDKNSGAISRYVSRDNIMAYTGLSTAQLNAANTTGPDGEFVMFDSTSGQFLKTTGPGTATTFISKTALDTFAGGSASLNASGVTFDADGNFYFLSNPATAAQKGVYKRTPAGVITQILSYANMAAVSGNASPSFRDMLCAPDGYIYLSDNTSNAQQILRFNPNDATNTIMSYLTNVDLLSGPAGGSNAIQSLSWYNDGQGHAGIAFNYANATSGIKGYYFVPEPGSLGLLGLGGLLLARRRRTA